MTRRRGIEPVQKGSLNPKAEKCIVCSLAICEKNGEMTRFTFKVSTVDRFKQFAVSVLAVGLFLPAAQAGDTRVLIWDERQPEQKQAYEDSLGEAIGKYLLKQRGFAVKYGSLEMPEFGIDDATLDDTDVIIWWGHKKNDAVSPERVAAVVNRVMAGRIGFIAIHSSIHARPFLRLMEERAKEDALKGKTVEEKQGLTFEFLQSPPRGVAFEPSVDIDGKVCRLMRPSGWIGGWRADAMPGHIETLIPEHPIAKGLPKMWSIPKTEMYKEPFHVPRPDAVVFEEKWEKGENFRSGCVWNVGNGLSLIHI
jgi:trehalose utilization protein